MNRYEYKGGYHTIKELSEMSGIAPHTLRDRLRRGYPVDEALKITAVQESVREFCDASSWEDWIGMPISDLFKIYWKWCIQHGYTALQTQGFSRHLLSMYPMLKTVPTKRGDKCCRIIRMK